MRRLQLAIGLAFLCIGGSLFVRTPPGPATANGRRFAPYTLETQTIAPDRNGVLQVTEERLVAVRTDGAEVWIGRFPQSSLGPMRKLMLPDGRATTVAESLGIRLSRFLPGIARPAAGGPASAGAGVPLSE